MSERVRYRICHDTAYEYASDVLHAHHLLHLIPRPTPYQQCLEHTISVKPATFRRRDEIDAFGNAFTRIEFGHPHRRLEIVTQMEVDVHPRPTVFAAGSMPWEWLCAELAYHGAGPTRENLEACRFRHESPYVRVKQEFTDYAADCFPAGRPILACADALMMKLHREVKYAPGATTVATPLREVLKNRRGVCQDFAHLMIACLRSRGLAARYVSGYLRAAPARSAAPAASPAIGAGASHAWVAVYTPPFGWLEFDPTNNVWVGTGHVAVAWGRDFGDVSPVHGVILGGSTHKLSVSVTVTPITQS
ncbi:MAG TPA: transglutaminase family protein [Steroidobacteraceae bacterium]